MDSSSLSSEVGPWLPTETKELSLDCHFLLTWVYDDLPWYLSGCLRNTRLDIRWACPPPLPLGASHQAVSNPAPSGLVSFVSKGMGTLKGILKFLLIQTRERCLSDFRRAGYSTLALSESLVLVRTRFFVFS